MVLLGSKGCIKSKDHVIRCFRHHSNPADASARTSGSSRHASAPSSISWLPTFRAAVQSGTKIGRVIPWSLRVAMEPVADCCNGARMGGFPRNGLITLTNVTILMAANFTAIRRNPQQTQSLIAFGEGVLQSPARCGRACRRTSVVWSTSSTTVRQVVLADDQWPDDPAARLDRAALPYLRAPSASLQQSHRAVAHDGRTAHGGDALRQRGQRLPRAFVDRTGNVAEHPRRLCQGVPKLQSSLEDIELLARHAHGFAAREFQLRSSCWPCGHSKRGLAGEVGVTGTGPTAPGRSASGAGRQDRTPRMPC